MVCVVASTAVVFRAMAWFVAWIPSVFPRIASAIWHPDPNAITNNDALQRSVLHFMAPTP